MTTRLAILLLLSATLACGLFGIGRSLWLDEAWVANSVHAPTLREMFYYPGWLQTSPPLFLLLERLAVGTLGLTSTTLRAVPLVLELAAVGFFFAAARRVVTLPFAVLATAVLAFHPVAIEYSRTAKQYSGEMAASAALLAVAAAHLARPSRSSRAWLLATLCVALPLAYSAVFLIPGITLALWIAGDRRAAAWIALTSAAILAILYPLFIAPNYSPALRAFWATDLDRAWSPGLIAAILVCAGGVARSIWLTRREPGLRAGMLSICALPGVLLTASAAWGLYPASPRTRLFALPGFVLLLAILVDDVLQRRPRMKTLASACAWTGVVAIPLLAGWRQIHEHRNLPEEDIAGAVHYLAQHASPSDLLLIHPSLKEGFELYAAVDGFAVPRPVYGDTGWPCCVRGHLAPPHSSSIEAVQADLEAKIPRAFTGRIWLLYSSRPTQWDYTGLDEGNLWRSRVWAMGCPPDQYVALANVSISPMNCAPRAASGATALPASSPPATGPRVTGPPATARPAAASHTAPRVTEPRP